MQCQIFGPVRFVGDGLMIVNEPFLGIVLCVKDLRLIQRLDYGWADYVTVRGNFLLKIFFKFIIQAFVTFTKEYPDLCRWIALAIKCSDDSDWIEV